MTTITIEADWAKIHRAAQAVTAIPGIFSLGTGSGSPFGGTYYGPEHEARGLAGLVAIWNAAWSYAAAAWDAVHDGATEMRKAEAIRDSDYDTEYWSVGGRLADKRCRSHRGAAWRSSVYGGVVETREVLHPERSAMRVAEVHALVAVAIRVAVSVDSLMRALASTGVGKYDPNSQICGIRDDGRINLQGLAWIQGAGSDDGHPLLSEAVEYAGSHPHA